MKPRYLYLLAIGAVCALLLGVGGVSSARADRTEDRLVRAIRDDRARIRRDEVRLDMLERRLSEQRYRRDWRGVRRTEDEMHRVHEDLARDRDRLRDHIAELERYRRYDRRPFGEFGRDRYRDRDRRYDDRYRGGSDWRYDDRNR